MIINLLSGLALQGPTLDPEMSGPILHALKTWKDSIDTP
jgi:hypothetical protein